MGTSTQTSQQLFARYLAERLKRLGKTATDLSDACGIKSLPVTQMMIDGRAKIPMMFVEPISRLLDEDPQYFGQLLVDAYNPGFEPALYEQVVQAEAMERLTLAHRSPVSGDFADDSSPSLGRLTFPATGGEEIGADDDLLIPTLRVRELFFQKPDGFTVEEAAEVLLVTSIEADWLLRQLQLFGYVAAPGQDQHPEAQMWTVTDRGLALAEAPARECLDRVSAFSLLLDLTQHIAVVNARSDLAYRVTGLTLIGEILTVSGGQRIPHPEATVILSPKYADPVEQKAHFDACLARAEADAIRNGDDFNELGEHLPVTQIQDAIRDGAGHVALRWFFDRWPSRSRP